MVKHMNDSDFSYLVDRRVKKLIDLNIESIVDVLHSDICTLKLTSEYLNRPVKIKEQQEIRPISWEQTKQFHSKTYKNTWGEDLEEMSHEKYEKLKKKKSLWSNEAKFWENNVQYETFAVAELMD